MDPAVAAFVAALIALPRATAGQDGKVADPWRVLQPVRMVSGGGATFTRQPDGSVLVGGANPDKDVWTLDFETDLAGITAFRLEALADPSLPGGGPGRASNGNFVLNELEASASAKLALRFKPVALENGSCDFIEPHRRATQVHDGDAVTGANGWAVWGAVGKDHQLVIETRADVRYDPPTLLRFELHFNWGSQHSIGRFRMSATTQPRPVRAPGSEKDSSLAKLAERVNVAIDRGIDYLLTKQQIDGSWNHEQWTYRNGATGLATYTLLKSGVSKRHPAVLRALEFMRGVPPRETYTIGCQLMALAALDDPAVTPWMKELAETLLSFQRDGFSYPWGAVDLSNTQYGVMGLRAAALHGVKVPPEAFERAAQQALEFAHEEGSGGYSPMGFSYNKPAKPTSSMTIAGTGILAIADEQLRGRAKTSSYASIARRGVSWLERHWSVEQNQFEGHDRWNIYFLYGLERVGSILKLEKMGPHDWYREGATRLVDTQGDKGQWSSSYKDEVIDTCFALLFLNRASAVASGPAPSRVKLYGADDPKQPVSLRASGDTPLSLWISSYGEKELAADEWPGESERGLRVRKVEYFATGAGFDDKEASLAVLEKDGEQPAGRERFAAQATFPLPGAYAVFARVTVLAPPAVEGGAPQPVVLESSRLDVLIAETVDPELIRCAKDPGRNLLAGQKVTASASSQLNGDWVPAHAADNLQCRGWAAKNDDPIPALVLELEKPVRASCCVITPAKIGDEYGSRITKLAVAVNGKSPPLLVDVPPGELRKLRVRFPQAQIVRRLEVKVLAKQECANAEKAVGLAEVELQVAE